MNISECSYCGMTAFSETGICPACEAALSTNPETEHSVTNETDVFQFQSADFPNDTAYTDTSETCVINQNSDGFAAPSDFQQTRDFRSHESHSNYQHQSSRPRTAGQTSARAKCMICGRNVPEMQRVCQLCANKKNPLKKLYASAAVLLILAVFGFGVYEYKQRQKNAPKLVLEEYAKLTGADKPLNFDSLHFTGDVWMEVSAFRSVVHGQSRTETEIYRFELTVQNPNKSYMEFYKTDPKDSSKKEVVYKQAFDGYKGWKFMKMFDQPAILEETDSDFETSKPEFFLGSYDSLEFASDETIEEYGIEAVRSMTNNNVFSPTSFLVDLSSFHIIEAKKNNDKTLLIFDKQNQQLLGLLKKNNSITSPMVMKIYANNYKQVEIKDKYFGGVTFRLPHQWKFEMFQKNINEAKVDAKKVNLSLSMRMNIENVETNLPVDEKIFYKPLSVFTAENKY